jgi:multidrug efflux pump subunit AcrB
VDLTPSKRNKTDIYADIRNKLSVLPASVAIGQPISHRLDHLQSGVRAQIVLKIYGQDLDTLRQLAEATRQRLSTISGLVDLQVEKQVLIPQVRIQVDHERAALHGLTPPRSLRHWTPCRTAGRFRRSSTATSVSMSHACAGDDNPRPLAIFGQFDRATTSFTT